MGHFLFQLGRRDPLNSDKEGGHTWGGQMLAIEDPYYKWWFENTMGKMADQAEAFVHFCIKPEHSCEFNGGYRTLIHADVFRIVTADEAEKARWCSAEMRAEVKSLIRFPEGTGLPEVPGRSVGVQPGPAGVTGLRQALEGTPAGGERDPGKDEDQNEEGKLKSQPAKRRKKLNEKDGSESSSDRRDYGKILGKRKPLSQAESALELRRTKKKKKRKKKRSDKNREAKQTSSSEGSSDGSSDDSSVFRVAPLPEGIDRLKRTHLKRPGRLADLTLQRYRELLLRSTGRGAEETEEVMPSVGRAYLQQVYFVQHPMQGLGQRTSREMRTLMLVVDYLTKNMVPSALDVLLQRQKALELSVEQQSWQQANLLELVDMEEARSYFTQELKAAQSQLKSEQKLQGKGGWRPFRAPAPWRQTAQDDTSKTPKDVKEGDNAPANEEPRKGKKGKKGRGKGRW